MSYELITLEYEGDFATITMNNPRRRNALSLKHMLELTSAFQEVGESSVLGVILAANGPAFSAGHDFADVVDRDLIAVRKLLKVCATLMDTLQEIPQPVLARVHALATAAGCQLVATCDLAVASSEAGFATPGGKGGWFCKRQW
jgi:enoyl-CoA hydratase/carnithine racemase